MSVFRFVPLLGLALALRTSPSAAADFTVTNFNDSDPPAAGSLRAAVQAANATPGLDRIFIPRDGTVAVTAGELTITDAPRRAASEAVAAGAPAGGTWGARSRP